MKLRVAWQNHDEAGLSELRVYVSRDQAQKGELVARVDPGDNSATFEWNREGVLWARVVPVNKAGAEHDWRRSGFARERLVTRQRVKPSASLSNVSVARTDNANQAAVIADPPASDEAETDVEVIAGPDAERGQLVSRTPIDSGGVAASDGDRSATVALGLDSGPGEGNDQTIVVRPVLREGRTPGDAETLTVPFLDRANHRPTLLASIVGDTLTGFSAPASTDGWEVDATDGVRLRALPAIEDLDANGWGTLGSGLLADQPIGAYFVTEAVVTSVEHDFGATTVFSLEMYDEAQRKTATGYFDSLALRHLQNRPFSPIDCEDTDEEELGPEWFFRIMTLEGKPERPLPVTVKEFRAGNSSPLAGAWTPYVPGARIRARYVETRWTFREVIGMHQLISPRVYARAWVSLEKTAAHIQTKGGAFTAGELGDVNAGGLDIGIRTDAGAEAIALNIDGTVFEAGLA